MCYIAIVFIQTDLISRKVTIVGDPCTAAAANGKLVGHFLSVRFLSLLQAVKTFF